MTGIYAADPAPSTPEMTTGRKINDTPMTVRRGRHRVRGGFPGCGTGAAVERVHACARPARGSLNLDTVASDMVMIPSHPSWTWKPS
jgi:hypothetical protein